MDLKNELLQHIQQISIDQNKHETKSNYRPKYSNEHYTKLIWSSTDYNDVENIQVQLIAVENDDQRDLFDYIRHTVSSMPQCQIPGRVLSVLVYDQYSQTYLGILQLTTDLLKSESKDNFIQPALEPAKRNRFKQHIRDHSVNLSICVPVQPFGYNFCGGKLLAMLAFSIELHQFYEKRYGYPIALVTTTSIHGKSIQYDRLKQLKFIGYTKGFGISHIPTSLLEKGKVYLEQNHPESLHRKQANWQLLKILVQKLDIDSNDVFYHGNQRGIYCGWTGANGSDFLMKRVTRLNQDKLQPVEECSRFWKDRWAKQRSTHLNKLKALD
ncbi:unnamed protein product [Adineta ricciae]|uniref:Uncharacterized protein n=1 Tax=Adineta ricciae TaxID=249248 RepID=A0A814KZ20_ADIRI|nr:unnamed protein product [Adineta ricciae]CAF1058108.1 unnamed protein product [Adineta ricciae]